MPRTRARIRFQPIVDLENWRLAGFEALARFQDDVSPLIHLDRAHHRGQRTKLELALAEAAIEEARRFPFPTVITINVSVNAMLSNRLCELVSARHHRWGLELLETSPNVGRVDLRAKVTRMDCLLLVDDAGVSFSDEERIRDLAPDVVKIDRTVFTAACENPGAYGRLHDLIAAGREAGSHLLVEGIESPEHLAFARAMRIDLGQGYFFGKAVAVDDIAALLASLTAATGLEVLCLASSVGL